MKIKSDLPFKPKLLPETLRRIKRFSLSKRCLFLFFSIGVYGFPTREAGHVNESIVVHAFDFVVNSASVSDNQL